LRAAVREDSLFTAEETSDENIDHNFRLLQACDNLSLLSCVAYDRPATLLHPLRQASGDACAVDVFPQGARSFRLAPYPFAEAAFTVELPARFVPGKLFASVEDFRVRYADAPLSALIVDISG
jgi:hypothetical protein